MKFSLRNQTHTNSVLPALATSPGTSENWPKLPNILRNLQGLLIFFFYFFPLLFYPFFHREIITHWLLLRGPTRFCRVTLEIKVFIKLPQQYLIYITEDRKGEKSSP